MKMRTTDYTDYTEKRIKRAFFLVLTVLSVVMSVSGNITNLVQEPFASTAVRTSASPGNLGTVTGNFYGAAVGPSTTLGGTGWSAALESSLVNAATYHLMPTSGGAATNVMFGAWFYIDSYNIGAGKVARMLWIDNSLGAGKTTDAELDLSPTGALNTQYYNDTGAAQTGIMQCPSNNWFWLGMVDTVNGSSHIAQAYAYTNGVFAAIGTSVTFAAGSSTFTYGAGGTYNPSGSPYWVGRYGMRTLCALGHAGDAAYLSSIFGYGPANNVKTQWFVSAATGNDSNTGLAGAPWQTYTNFLTNLNDGVVFWSTTNRPGHGDTVTIDNTSPLVFGDTQLYILANGVDLEFTNGAVQAYSIINADGWTVEPGYASVYYTTDGGSPDLLNIVCWENKQWLTHYTGAGFSAVASELEAQAGSFYCDGTYLYVHPFGSTDPATDGNVYTRSHNFGLDGSSAIICDASNIVINGLEEWGTAIAGAADNSGGTGYNLELQNINGTNIISNCNLDYASKHAIGRTSVGTNTCVIYSNVTAGVCSPYNTIAGATSDYVDYASAGFGNSYYYYNCTNLTNTGIIGGYGGVNTTISSSWQSHSAGTSNQFSYGLFSNCVFCGAIVEQGVNDGIVILTNSTFDSATLACRTVANGCKTLDGPLVINTTNSLVCACTNDIFHINFTGVSASYWYPFSGTQLLVNCTIDCRPWTSGVGQNRAVFGWNGPSGLVMENTIFQENSSSDFSVLYNFSSNDLVDFGTNLYQLGSGGVVAKNYSNSVTGANYGFSGWQGIGKDNNSASDGNLELDTNEVPYASSPALAAAQSLGAFGDYTGQSFANRNSIGAYQFRTNYFVTQNPIGRGDGSDAADADGINQAYFNVTPNWEAGFTWDLVDTITNSIFVLGGGAPGNPLTLYFESNAMMSAPIWDTAPNYCAIDGQSHNDVVIDGGVNGVIQATECGSFLPISTYSCNGINLETGSRTTVKNLMIRNLWVRHQGDTNLTGGGIGVSYSASNSGTNVVTNCVIHDAQIGVSIGYFPGANSNYSVVHCTITNCNWGVNSGDANSTSFLNGLTISGCTLADWQCWDDNYAYDSTHGYLYPYFHHNGVFVWTQNGGLITNVSYIGNHVGPGYGNNSAGLFASGAVCNALVYNNVLDGSDGTSPADAFVFLWGDGNRGPCIGQIHQNTFAGAGNGTAIELDASGATGTVAYYFTNNLISDMGAVTVNYYQLMLEEYFWNDYNLYYDIQPSLNGEPANTGFSISASSSAAYVNFSTLYSGQSWQSQGHDVNGQTINPQLNANFVPQNPAIDAGANLTGVLTSLGIPTADYAGNGRPALGPWAPGAFQFPIPGVNYGLTFTNAAP
ncbi:MAG TPA: hypothetical protein VMR33_04735 [Candidatus Baltobacteraceae bacterium]|jgi:hypothetical protein|nr:hypothetical protein [Candidatus Baltobacteraceae bacterium]